MHSNMHSCRCPKNTKTSWVTYRVTRNTKMWPKDWNMPMMTGAFCRLPKTGVIPPIFQNMTNWHGITKIILIKPPDLCAERTEGTAWQWLWFVPHDVDSLVQLLGGKGKFTAKLDQLFKTDSKIVGELISADISGLIGQYAHGNEPSHHIIHFYNYVGQPYKTQELIDSVLHSQYTDKVDGLAGNEDCGQMSAWYILNAMGFYQVCPGKPVYSIGRPLFDKVTVNLPGNKTFTIKTYNNKRENKYITSIKLNGHKLEKPFFTHAELMAGGTLEMIMSDKPKR